MFYENFQIHRDRWSWNAESYESYLILEPIVVKKKRTRTQKPNLRSMNELVSLEWERVDMSDKCARTCTILPPIISFNCPTHVCNDRVGFLRRSLKLCTRSRIWRFRCICDFGVVLLSKTNLYASNSLEVLRDFIIIERLCVWRIWHFITVKV